MARAEDLNQRLAQLALSRQQSWEAVREAQTLVRTGIANFENRCPRWVKPTPSPPSVRPAPSFTPRYERILTRLWQSLPMLIGAVLGLVLADWLGAW
ncbi:MAG: hypothetical protein Q6J18_05500 [Gloeomargarita sp. DG02_3_bins_56]